MKEDNNKTKESYYRIDSFKLEKENSSNDEFVFINLYCDIWELLEFKEKSSISHCKWFPVESVLMIPQSEYVSSYSNHNKKRSPWKLSWGFKK